MNKWAAAAATAMIESQQPRWLIACSRLYVQNELFFCVLFVLMWLVGVCVCVYV